MKRILGLSRKFLSAQVMKPAAQLLASTVLALSTYNAVADNPLVSHVYTADPSGVVFNDRVYVITTHDPDGSTDYSELQDYFLWSTDDMVNWQDHGIIFGTQTHTNWAFGAYAPDMFERNGKFYLIFPNVTSGLGILEADHPEGPYVDIKGSAVITAQNTQNANVEWLFDPGVLVDDDNSVYVTFGGGGPGEARIVKLRDDLMGPDGPAVTVDAPNFFEASYIHKRDGVYYFSYSKDYTGGAPTIEYMTSDNPMTGYRHRGTVIPQPWDNYSGNNHHSFIEYKGQWYAFYHNQTVWASGPGNGTGSIYQRSMNVDVLSYRGDVMNRVTPTREGVQQIKNFDPFRKVEAEIFDNQSGIETERHGDGSMYVEMDNNDWFRVAQVDFASGANFIEAHIAAGSNTNLEMRLGSPSGTLAGTIQVNSTGGLNSYTATTANLAGVNGVHDVYFVAKGRLNFNWYQVTGEPEDCGTAEGVPVCCEMASDVDRDGWGVEWGNECKVTDLTRNFGPLNDASIVAAINAGATAGDYFQNVYYQPDVFSDGGTPYSTEDLISGADGSSIFASELWSDSEFGYNIDLENGDYTVELHFAEIYHEAVGERVFNVSVENQTVLSNLDIFDEVGHDAAFTEAAINTTVTDGILNISFVPVEDNPKISGLLVKKREAPASSSAPSSSSSEASSSSEPAASSSSSEAASSSAASSDVSSSSSSTGTSVLGGAFAAHWLILIAGFATLVRRRFAIK